MQSRLVWDKRVLMLGHPEKSQFLVQWVVIIVASLAAAIFIFFSLKKGGKKGTKEKRHKKLV